MARVLVVDDSSIVLSGLQHMIESLGHTPVPAEDGAAACIALHNNGPFDLVVCDLEMGQGKVTGFEVHDFMQEDPKLAGIKFIMGTGSPHLAMAECQKRGIPCLSKPYSAEALLDAAGGILG